MWNFDERYETDGACGDISAEMGIEAWDILRREGALCGCEWI